MIELGWEAYIGLILLAYITFQIWQIKRDLAELERQAEILELRIEALRALQVAERWRPGSHA